MKTRVYTLCGSSRFPEAFHLVNAHLSLRGHIVISLGLFGHADEPRGARFLTSDGDESTAEKVALDQLHFRKIDLSDAIYVVNVGGYVGSSTRREIEYAQSKGKAVEWLFKPTSVGAEPHGQEEDHAEFLQNWAADIRKHSGPSVDADRLDVIAQKLSPRLIEEGK